MIADNRIFFASDIHGSDVCFRKFINAAKAYNVGALILGGDITGKGIVPLLEQRNSTLLAHWNDQTVVVDERDAPKLEERIRFSGLYPVRVSEERATLFSQSSAEVESAFNSAIESSIRRWIAFADERIDPETVECYISPGNDDAPMVGDLLRNSKAIVNPDERVVLVLEQFEMLSLGFSNPTPFHTPRELPEDVLKGKIDALAADLRDPSSTIFNIHCPPFDSGIDTAVELDDQQRIVSKHGQPVPSPIGSTAVRECIMSYQPLLGLHGHVHESRGTALLGRTLCINPGSRYSEGTLNGVLITLRDGKVVNFQFVAA